MTLKEIAQIIHGRVVGPEDIEITGPAKIEEAGPGEITFLANPKYRHFLSQTEASAIIVDQTVENIPLPHIVVKDAYVGFVLTLKLFEPPKHVWISGISDKAFIDPSATVSPSARIAPMVYIGPNVSVDSDTIIYPGVVILEKVQIGRDCVLYPNVTIREECRIGDRVILHNGCVVGSDGFGFAPSEGRYIKIPQMGNVIIEDDVEIGANSTIDRATVGSSVIGRGTKLDNLVQVAHNVIIGQHTVIASQSGVAGSTRVGNHVTIGGQVGITGHVQIGDDVVFAAQAGVTKSHKSPGVFWGSPARPLNEQKRIEVSLRKLPDLVKRVQQLETEIFTLKNDKKK